MRMKKPSSALRTRQHRSRVNASTTITWNTGTAIGRAAAPTVGHPANTAERRRESSTRRNTIDAPLTRHGHPDMHPMRWQSDATDCQCAPANSRASAPSRGEESSGTLPLHVSVGGTHRRTKGATGIWSRPSGRAADILQSGDAAAASQEADDDQTCAEERVGGRLGNHRTPNEVRMKSVWM